MSNKTVTIGKKNVSVIGTFQLKVKLHEKRFRMTNINSFVPQGKGIEDKLYFRTADGPVGALIISKLITVFKPDTNQIDLHNINVLIQHKDVMIGGMSNDEHMELVRLGLKRSNPKFELINIDKVDDEQFEEEINLVQVRAKLLDPKNPLSKEKLVFIASNFGIPYKNNFTDEKKLVRFLLKRIDSFIKGNKEHRDSFMQMLDNMKLTELKYYINEFMELGLVTYIGGIYKVKEIPIGANKEKLYEYFDNNPQDFNILKEAVIRANEGAVYS